MQRRVKLSTGSLWPRMKARLVADKKLLVAVSGGGDSVALLHLVLPPVAERKRLLVAAVHHGDEPHGSESLAFVRRMCKRLSVPFRPLRVTVNPHREKEQGYEAAAREVRYRALEELGRGQKCGLMLTAHTRDDRAEGLLIGLLRGGDVGALASVRGDRGRWHRPLLEVGREELRDFLTSNGIAWLEDPYNELERFTRVRVRQYITPVIREQFGEAGWKSLAASAARLEQAEEALSELTQGVLQQVTDGSTHGWIAIETEQLRGYVEQVRSRVLLAAWTHAASAVDPDAFLPRKKRVRLESLLLTRGSGRSLQLGPVRVSASGSRILFDALSQTPGLTWKLPGRITLADGSQLAANLMKGSAALAKRSEAGVREFIDAERVKGPLTVRPWRPGDRWTPQGRDGREVKVVRSLRRAPGMRIGVLWVVEDATGEIVWIPGERISHSCSLNERTLRVWKLVWTPPPTDAG